MTLQVGPTEDMAACVGLRRAVFIEEQGVPEDVEQDGRDGAAHHVLATLDGVPVGCGRILVEGATGKIGRVSGASWARDRAGAGRRLPGRAAGSSGGGAG